ncbi:MAG: RdgB/HAM1 family non-canonical purine NTP pyrophosphatase [Thiotrichales bacterium]
MTAKRGHRVVLASNNAGKLRELRAVLEPIGFELFAQSAFNVPEADETGLTFVENALLKARNACLHTGLPALADDSGIEVDALNGRPGIYSARYAGPGASDADNNALLLDALDGVPDDERGARYRAVIVYLRHAEDPAPIIAEGVWAGALLRAPQGSGGFGYDPLFWLPELGKTSAELDPATKNSLSHRGQALGTLMQRLRELG